MIPRILTAVLREAHTHFPVLFLTGPRQSGKTTLLRATFPEMDYVSLENPDKRRFASEDPYYFLGQFKSGAIIDEAQHVPELFSYMQGLVDEHPERRFLLSGSQNFLLLERISQSLAGRTAVLTLLPLSMRELSLLSRVEDYHALAFRGFYPRLYDAQVPTGLFYSSYIQTYIERDVRMVKNIGDLGLFSTFLRLCAGRAGQLLNLSSLASDVGISVNTAKAWLSLLEASYIVYQLRPHHVNFNKRLVKTPKLYFHDTGLLCNLLDIRSPEELSSHYAKGAVFENMVVMELVKSYQHRGKVPHTWFWRDHKGNEVDVLLDQSGQLTPIEIKAGQTINGSFFKNLIYWCGLSGQEPCGARLIYGGEENQQRKQAEVISWKMLYEQDLV